ncbi:MAG TPA: transglutaminase-like domain-containing protein, partial [Longimicrobiales bacterium]
AGSLAGQLGSLAWALLQTRPDFPAWLGGHFAAFEPLRLAWADLAGSATVFSARIASWIAGARQGSPAFDPLIPTLAWGWAAWLAASWAGWALGRRFTAVAALFPALVLLAGGCGFTRFDPTALIYLLGCLVAASILFAAVHREQGWAARGLDYSTETRLDLAEVSIPLVVLVVGVSAILPLLSWETLFERPRPQTQPPGSAETVLRSFGLQLPTRVPTVLDSYFTPGLPRQHLIGSGPELARRVALTVRVLDPAPAAPRTYWREFTYDRYLGSGWQTSGTQAARFPAGASLAAGSIPGGAARFEVHPGPQASGILIYTGTLLSADRDVTLQSRSSGDLFAGYLQPGSYIVTAARPAYDPAQLRAAGQDYPDGVKRAYLQLPSSLPNRVVSLARELTAAQATPYDRAAAIERYLRALPYTLDLPAPPPGHDIVDYFLFDLKKGYCDYFATAMAVLARTAGIPARLVVGYAPGQYDPAERTFTVRESDAHSWTELYFPGYGWVEFDSTPGIGAGEADLPPAGVPPSFPEPAPPVVSPVESLARAAQRVPWGWAAAVLA